MPVSAWIMGIVTAVVLYGGLAWCLSLATKKKS